MTTSELAVAVSAILGIIAGRKFVDGDVRSF
jgi:hypothetical protein